MANTAIEFKDVVKTYGKGDGMQTAVDHVSFTIDEGEFVVILGQSGAGKSTVLNMLGGMDVTTEGKVIVDGQEISSFKDKKLSQYRADTIGFIFQFYNLIPGLTAYENVALVNDIKKNALDANEMLDRVGLSDQKHKFPSQMSGGQQQRMSIARALAKDPKIILGDEPTGALDSETGKLVIDMLQKLSTESGKTVILVTHNADIAKCANKIIHMRNGKIMLHYLSYSFILSVLGCAAGILLGIYTFGRIMVDMFSQFYRVPGWSGGFNYKSIVVAAVIVLFCVGASYLSCKQILRIHPSEALRPAAAKTAKPCIFEKLPFWGSLRFTARYSLRDISRSKMRAFMGVFGTCMGMIVMVLGLGAFDTLGFVRGWYFDDMQNYQSQVLFSDSVTIGDAEDLADEYSGELIGMGLISIAAEDHPVSDDIISCKLTVTEGKGLFCISDSELNVVPLKKGTVALTMKQAAAFVMIVSVLVGFMFSKRIKRIDMVGVLKGME